MTNQLTPKDVRRWRTAAGMTQPAFAEMLGLSRATIARWETDGATDIPKWTGFARAGWEMLKGIAADEEGDTVTVYKFQRYNITTDSYDMSPRMATRAAIEKRRCEVLEGTGISVDRRFIDSEGMLAVNYGTALGFDAPKGKGVP